MKAIEPFLTVRETAYVLKMTPDKIRALCKQGALPYSRLPGKNGAIRIRPEAIRSFQRRA